MKKRNENWLCWCLEISNSTHLARPQHLQQEPHMLPIGTSRKFPIDAGGSRMGFSRWLQVIDTPVLPTYSGKKVIQRAQLKNYIKLTTVLATLLHHSPIALNFPPCHIHKHTYTFKYFQVFCTDRFHYCTFKGRKLKSRILSSQKTFFPSLTQSLFFHFAFPNFCTIWQAKGLKELFSEQLSTDSQKFVSFWFLKVKQRCWKLWCVAWNSEKTH